MASVTFSPIGTQLDNDEITDIQVNEGDSLGFSFTLDTSGLDAELQSLKLQLQGDSTEVNLSDTLTDFFTTTFPDVAVVEDNSDGDFISVVVELKGEPGAIANTTNVLVESEATVEDGLVNDGATDIGVTVLEAIDANGTDVTEQFVPPQQAIDLQLPQVQEILGTPESEPIIGTPQNDLIKGKEGNDLIIDSEGNDLFLEDTGNDTIRGGSGNDFVNIDSDSGGDDIIDLGTGNNFAFGGSGIDVMGGGQGDDLFFGGAGNDALFGNEGHDTFIFLEEGADIIYDFEPGEDAIALTTNSSYDSLQIEYNPQGNYTNISEETGELIATVIGVEADQLTESNFDTYDKEMLPEVEGSYTVDNLFVFGDRL